MLAILYFELSVCLLPFWTAFLIDLRKPFFNPIYIILCLICNVNVLPQFVVSLFFLMLCFTLQYSTTGFFFPCTVLWILIYRITTTARIQNSSIMPQNSLMLSLCITPQTSGYPLLTPITDGHINGIIQYVYFWDWILSFAVILLKFIQAIAYISNSILLLSSIPLINCTTVWLSVHLLKTIWVIFSLGQLWKNCYKHLCTGFCVSTDFHFCKINTKEWDCWVIW